MIGIARATPAHLKRFGRLRELGRTEEGAAIIEFALHFARAFLVHVGTFDAGHTLYMKSRARGRGAKGSARYLARNHPRARISTVRDAIDEAVESQLSPLHRTATITFESQILSHIH